MKSIKILKIHGIFAFPQKKQYFCPVIRLYPEMTPIEALHTYWHYDAFRPLQEDIIRSVMDGRDTLALMPTGGGKSLCFQVPTMAQDGLCLVITPLIALMKDQVENLLRRDIRAAALYTGMTYDEQQRALDNCQYGPYHFLYVSPERLMSQEFINRVVRLPITLIAVDEAHCISEWGYDFRPAYLRIAAIREHIHCPILALTATATPKVVDDIQDRLDFATHHVFRQSFHRENLSYIVRTGDARDKEWKRRQLAHILSKVPGTAIVYVRNRQHSEELSEFLIKQGEQATFYHAGLTSEERSRRQLAWKENTTRIMVCTNAFGMGIDKSDVRLVIHYDLPDSPEAYFQEAGRAGRDGLPAWCVLLYDHSDHTKAEKRVRDTYPPKEFVEDIYHKVCDYLVIGAGSGLGYATSLHVEEICQALHLPILQTYSALHILSQTGYIHFEDEQETQPRVRLNIPREGLRLYTLDALQQELLEGFMRHYPGVFTDLQYIREEITRPVHQALSNMAARHIITYLPRTRASLLVLTRERQTDIFLPDRVYTDRLEGYKQRLYAMVEYAEQQDYCREQVLLSYFGENDAPICTHCDCCRKRISVNV